MGVQRSRWAGSWQILREGFSEARRAATDGFEAIKQASDKFENER